jgi:hypothetical protein
MSAAKVMRDCCEPFDALNVASVSIAAVIVERAAFAPELLDTSTLLRSISPSPETVMLTD